MTRRSTKSEDIRDIVRDIHLEDSFVNAICDRVCARLEERLIELISSKLESGLARISSSVSSAMKELLKPLNEKISRLERENAVLLNRVESLDLQSRSCDLIICGVKECSFAEAASTSDAKGEASRFDTVQSVVDCCKSEIGVEITAQDIVKAHRIQGTKGKRPILVTFAKKITRDSIIKCRKRLGSKKSGIFINENLTKSNSDIFATLRKFKREGKLFACWSFNGSIYYKIKSESNSIKVQHIDEIKL